MGTELRQAYKAIYTELTAQNVSLVSTDSSSKVIIYCDEGGYGSFAILIEKGKVIPLSFTPEDSTVLLLEGKLFYTNADDVVTLFYKSESATSTIGVKTNIIFGSVKSFLQSSAIDANATELLIVNDIITSRVFETPTITDGKTSLSQYIQSKKPDSVNNVITTYFDDEGKQHLEVPGGISTTAGSASFDSLTVTGDATINGTVKVGSFPGASTNATQTLREYINSVVKTDLVYDGEYDQN